MADGICPFRHPWKPGPMDPQTCAAIMWGIMGAVGISGVFYLVQALGMGSLSAPASFMAERWYFVLPLAAGFGVQAGLFAAIRAKARRAGGALAASGGVSTSSMIACCAHNLVPLLPILGVTGIAAFLAEYQAHIFLLSIAFVLGGAAYMWRVYRRVREHGGGKCEAVIG